MLKLKCVECLWLLRPLPWLVWPVGMKLTFIWPWQSRVLSSSSSVPRCTTFRYQGDSMDTEAFAFACSCFHACLRCMTLLLDARILSRFSNLILIHSQRFVFEWNGVDMCWCSCPLRLCWLGRFHVADLSHRVACARSSKVKSTLSRMTLDPKFADLAVLIVIISVNYLCSRGWAHAFADTTVVGDLGVRGGWGPGSSELWLPCRCHSYSSAACDSLLELGQVGSGCFLLVSVEVCRSQISQFLACLCKLHILHVAWHGF